MARIIQQSVLSRKDSDVRQVDQLGNGAGLHFDGSAGNVDIASPPALGTKFSMEFVLKADKWNVYQNIIDIYAGSHTGGRLEFYSPAEGELVLYQSSVPGNRSFDVSVLDDLKAHHLVVTVDGTSAILYDNGNQVGTTDIAATALTGGGDLKLGSSYDGGGGHFNGTIYRARLYNRTLSAPEVKSAFEGSNVDFADQYGVATNEITNSNFDTNTNAWDKDNCSTFERNTTLPISGSGDLHWIGDGSGYPGIWSDGITFVKGKNYRVNFTYRVPSGTAILEFGKTQSTTASLVSGIAAVNLTTGYYNTDYEAIITPTETCTGYFIARGANDTTPEMYLDSVEVVRVGAVTDWDFSAANPTQSNQLQDRAGVADGTIDSGVVQVNPVEQVNTNQLRVSGTIPLVGIGVAAGTTPAGTLHIGNSVVGDNNAVYIQNTNNANNDTAAIRFGFGGASLANKGGIFFKREVPGTHGVPGGSSYGRGSLIFATENTANDDNVDSSDVKLTILADGNVGIGTDSPGATFQVSDSGGTDRNAWIRWNSSEMEVVGITDDGNTFKPIRLGGDTVKLATGEAGLTDRLTINSSGNATLGSTQLSTANLNINGTGGVGGGLLINRNTSGSPTSGQYLGSVGFKGVDSANSNAAAEASIVAKAMEAHSGSTAGTNLEFYTKPGGSVFGKSAPSNSPTLCLTLDSTGLATFANGIAFSSQTDAAGMTATTLDHYEEGTWTPAIACTTSGTASVATTHDLMRYTRIGRIVTVQGMIKISAISSPLGDLHITGLPFTPGPAAGGSNDYSGYAATAVKFANMTGSNFNANNSYFPANSALLVCRGFDGLAEISTLAANLQIDSTIMIGGSYTVA